MKRKRERKKEWSGEVEIDGETEKYTTKLEILKLSNINTIKFYLPSTVNVR